MVVKAPTPAGDLMYKCLAIEAENMNIRIYAGQCNFFTKTQSSINFLHEKITDVHVCYIEVYLYRIVHAINT